MSSPLLYIPPDLPPHCEPDTPLLVFFSQTFGTCLPSYLALLSTTAGIFSIISWLFAQIPQIWKNYQRGSVDGLSLGFLTIWLGGDVCNLLGALWTGQMWFQQAVAAYYVFVDIVLVSQYFYFILRPTAPFIEGRPLSYDDSIDDDDDSEDSYLVDSDVETDKKRKKGSSKAPSHATTVRSPGRSRSLASTLIVAVSLMLHLVGASPVERNLALVGAPAKSGSTLQELGGVLSWFSTLLYLTSRFPQLLLNFRRRSTSGLAISLFVAAFFGNFFYSLSLILNPLGHYDLPPYGGGGLAGENGNNRLEWWGRTLPFFLGASGVLGLDAAVGWQWLVWGEQALVEDQEDIFDDDEEVECFGVHTSWNKLFLWNGWFEDSDADVVKPLAVDRRTGYGTGSGTASGVVR